MALANVCTSCSNTSASSAATNAVLQKRLRVANRSGRPRGRPLGDEWTAGEVDSAPGSGAQLDPPTSSVSHRVLGRTQEAPVRRTGRLVGLVVGDESRRTASDEKGRAAPPPGAPGWRPRGADSDMGKGPYGHRPGGVGGSRCRSRRVAPLQNSFAAIFVRTRASDGRCKRETAAKGVERANRSACIATDIGEIRPTRGGGRVAGSRGAKQGGVRMSMGVVGRAGGGTGKTRAATSGRGLQISGGHCWRGEGGGARGEGRGACAFGMRSGRFAARGESRESRTASSATCHDVPRDVPRFDDGLVAAAAPGQSAVRGRQAQTRRPHDARHALDRPPVRLALGPRGSKARGRAWEGVQRLGSCG